MLISNKHQFIFIHNPKTGGMSVMNSLLPYANKLNKLQHTQLEYYLKRIIGRGWVEKTIGGLHIPAARLRTHYSASNWSGYFKFAFVRNPYKRILSYYDFIRKAPEHDDHKWVRSHSLEEYVMAVGDRIYHEPQHYYLCDDNDDILVDFVGRFARLEEDFRHVTNVIDLPGLQLAHLNKGQSDMSNDLEKLTPEMIDHINEVYEKDFVIFNYDRL